MGEVYRAHDKRLGRNVAVKVLGEALVQNPVAVRRFEQEARAASALSHPHIIHIYDIGSSKVAGQTIRYIVMELIEGNTLAEHIHSRRTELPKLLGWMVQVCDALAKAHSAGIVHRDLKPDNIMIATDGYAKILDFGLAKLFEQDSPAPEDATAALVTPLSTRGVLVGTAAYMSPEQAQAGRTDFRTDIFAIGAILYECATRAAAFRGASLIDTLHQVVHSDPNLGALPAGLTPIVRKALAKNPVERHESARNLAADLQTAIRSGLTEERSTSRARTAHEHTLAVLPFDDISPDHDNEYFSDGLTEEIISDLSKIRSLRVISRTSVMKFKGAEKDLDAVAQQLGVEYVIDGSVRKAGKQLRITAELVDAKTKEQLWSERYNGILDDIFEIQESVARSIAQRLQIELTSAESAQLAERPISDVQAYECLLRARRDILRFDEQGLRSALHEIEQGLSLSPNNVPLLAARGYAHWQYYNAGIDPDPEHLERAEEHARRIFELAPDSPHGHRLLGLIYLHRSKVRDAERHLRRAVEGDPTDTDALMWLAGTSVFIGKLDDALRLSERLEAIDPLAATSHLSRGAILAYTGDAAGALPHLQRAQEIAGYSFLTVYYVQCLALLRRFDEARHHARAFLAAQPANAMAKITMALVHAIDGDVEQAQALLDDRVREVARADFQYSSWIGEIYALLEDKQEALDWLESSIRRGYTTWVYFTRVDWFLDNLRGDSRFEALMELARKQCEAVRAT